MREMVYRGLLAAGLILVVGGWTAYAAIQAIDDVGRTVAFGLQKVIIRVDVNRASKGDQFKPLPVQVKAPPYFGPPCSFLSPAWCPIG